MKKVCSRWTAHDLLKSQNHARIDWCKQMLKEYNVYAFEPNPTTVEEANSSLFFGNAKRSILNGAVICFWRNKENKQAPSNHSSSRQCQNVLCQYQTSGLTAHKKSN